MRPTAERAREALFAILGPAVAGARVLDAYAGSGALGFEALSRGAARVTFLEVDLRAAGRLARNAEELGVAARCEVVPGAAVPSLEARRVRGPFELILADPPWTGDEPARFLPVATAHLAPTGQIVVERDAGSPGAGSPASLALSRSERYGRCCFDFYRFRPAGEPRLKSR